jgi:TonB family protein
MTEPTGRQDAFQDGLEDVFAASEAGDPSRRFGGRHLLVVVAVVVVAGGLAALVFVTTRGDAPPRPVHEISVVTLLPPPPPPPPPPTVRKEPEPQMIEQPKIVDEPPEEEKPVDKPKPDDAKDEPPPGPLALAAVGAGPGDQFGLAGNPGGRGLLGGGPGGGGGRWGRYAAMVQAEIEAALRANPKTNTAVMQVRVRLWADRTGRISRVELAESSGNSELDAVLRDGVLANLALREPPPDDMPMPIVARITARHPG